MIVFDGVTKRFPAERSKWWSPKTREELTAVRALSFQCHPGRICALLGPNGSGKTTALRMVATLLRPSEGRVEITGLDSVEEAVAVRRKIGFLTGTTSLYRHLSPLETLRYFGGLYGLAPDRCEERARQLIERFGIGSFQDRPIARLSMGMKQKVSIARILLHDPEVMVFDEVTVGLDVLTSRNVIALVRECREQGKTVLFSTHLMEEVAQLADDVVVIHEGEKVFAGKFEDLESGRQAPSLQDEFIRLLGDAV
ncbi:MAG: ATP-binding cassette domain-containing protein [Verrucomicrobiota bacterium]